jgi:hypothetical protein
MRRTKTIEIAGQPLTFLEIPVRKIHAILTGETAIFTIPMVQAAEKVKELIPFSFEGDIESLLAADLFYDDLAEIYAAFEETNPAFFELARVIGLENTLAAVVKSLFHSFFSELHIYLNSVTVPESGSTATDISSI